jgi:hypothetical protein
MRIALPIPFCCVAIIMHAQEPEPQWVYTHHPDTTRWYEAVDMITDNNGNTYVLGCERLGGGQLTTGFTIKVDANGELAWVDEMGPAVFGSGRVKLDEMGNVYIATRLQQTQTNWDLFTRKYAPDGTVLWTATLDGPSGSMDRAQDLAIDAAHHVYVTGAIETVAFPNTQEDVVTVKYDETGGELWVATYDHTNEEVGQGIAVDGEGNVYVSGASPDDSLGRGLTLKYSPTGDPLWERRVHGDLTYGRFACWGPDEQLVVVGAKDDGVLCVKYDAAGNETWLLNTDTVHWPNDVDLDADGNVLITGWHVGAIQHYTVKIDPNGSIAWLLMEGVSPDDDQGRAIALDEMGNVYVAADSYNNGTAELSARTMMLAPDGTLLWTAAFHPVSGGQHEPFGINVDAAGSIYVGSSVFNNGPNRFEVIKYAKPLAVASNAVMPALQLYPNPTNGIMHLQGLANAVGNYSVFDAIGRSVLVGALQDGLVDVRSLHAGHYILQFIVDRHLLHIPFVRDDSRP